MLHRRAGSQRVLELHGTPEVHHCVGCGRQWPYNEIAAIVRDGGTPSCDACGGVVKPNITFFGEMLDTATIDAAIEEATHADLMLVLGSSLVVQPAASVPLYAVERGADLYIVNNMETPLDRYAEERHGDLEEVFGHVAAQVG
jgi:NAD-dependent deacetylase